MKLEKFELERLEWLYFREKCKRSFYFFFKEFWEVNNKEPLVDSAHLKILCEEAELVVRRIVARLPKEYDLIVNVPPGSSKSNIFSQALEAWAWILDPTLQFITASHSYSLSLSLSVKSRDIIKSEKFRKYFPEIELRKDLNAKGLFSNSKGGYRYTCTPGISPIGRHAHLIVVDDPIDPMMTTTDAARNFVNEWFKNTLPTRVVDKSISAMILVMQRLHEDDPTGFLLKEQEHLGKIRHICLPAELADNVSPVEYRSIYVNGLLDPIRLSEEVLVTMKERLGVYNYAGQLSQDPAPQTGGMFSTEKFKITRVIPDRIVRMVRSWDKAGTEGGGCDSAGVKIGELANGEFIILDSIAGQWRYDKREAIIKQTAELDGRGVKIVIEQEPGSGGMESAQSTVKNLRGFTVKVDKPGRDKVTRAEPLSTQVNFGNVWILEGPWNAKYIEEFRLFPRGKWKDQVDATTQGFSLLAGKGKLDYRELMTSAAKKARESHEMKRKIAPKEVNGILLP